MDAASSETLTILRQLLPGFVAAWIRFLLIPNARRNDLDRVVEAMILSGVLAIAVAGLRWLLILPCSRWGDCIATWSANSEFAWSMLLAAILGLLLAQATRSDSLYALLRKAGLTHESGLRSVRYSAFTTLSYRNVILHLKDKRRVLGYPKEGDYDPEDPESGCIFLQQAYWLDGSNNRSPAGRLLIPWTEIQLVQFFEGSNAHEPSRPAVDPSDAESRRSGASGQRSNQPVDKAGSTGKPGTV
ncbi:MAG: hypothetical protein JSS21_09455 [Proteobacteria bacterium]|nr:hypothetical protein [Pseudomonadota bacterium]